MAPLPGTNTGLSPPLERPCLQNCPAASWYFHKIINKTQQTHQNQKTPHQQNNNNKTPKPEQQQLQQKQTNKQHPLNKQENPNQPLLLHFFLAILSLFSPCVLLCGKFTPPISFYFPVLFFFLVPQMYFSCVKYARKYLQVSNCPSCLSAVTALFPLAELHPVPNNFSSLCTTLMPLFKVCFVHHFCQIFTQCAPYRSRVLSCLLQFSNVSSML